MTFSRIINLFIVFLFLHNYQACAQIENQSDNSKKTKNDEQIFNFIEKYPQFPGGDSALIEYIKANLTYPTEAMEKGIEGTVIIQFVVEKDGSITNVIVTQSIGGGCDEEAVRVIKSLPKWEPGMQKGQPIRVYFTIPIEFVLNNNE